MVLLSSIKPTDAGIPMNSITLIAWLNVSVKFVQSLRAAYVEKYGNTAVAIAIPNTPNGNWINLSP